jgi:hypothetical protein
MLALIERTSTDVALIKIAKAFLRQKYPLTAEGESLKKDIEQVLVRNDLPWLRGNVWQLPTVENERRELFAELNGNKFIFSHIFGSDFATIQTHNGCSHQCQEFCYASAGKRICNRIPYMAAFKIALEKRCQDSRLLKISFNWLKMIKDIGLIDKNGLEQQKKIKAMNSREFFGFMLSIEKLADTHPVRAYPIRWPAYAQIDFDLIWHKYLSFLPMEIFSFRSQILTYIDNDPLEYFDRNFCHDDGTYADYGDIFNIFTTPIRPIYISTAGWQSTNKYAECSVEKILQIYKDNKLSLYGFRLSINKNEVLARTNYPAYIENLKRMINILFPALGEDLYFSIFYDPRIEGDIKWAESVHNEIESFAQERFGKSLGIDNYVKISHSSGLAYDQRYAKEDFNVDTGDWGYHIHPDGRVYYQEEPEWERKLEEGRLSFHLQPNDCKHKFTRLKLW